MTPERWQRVKRILEKTLECDPSSRPSHLAMACAGDDGLKRDVESFLTHEDADASRSCFTPRFHQSLFCLESG